MVAMALDQNDPGSETSIADPLIILVLMSISLFGNSLLIISRAVTSGRRADTFNIYMISMAAFGLLECSLTMSLATGFSIEKEWNFGDFLMGFNCCFTQLQNIGVFLTITAMSADRYIVVCKLMGRRQTSVNHANYTVIYTWFHAFIISLPLLLYRESKLELRPYVDRNLCGLSEGAITAYTWAVIVSSFIVPSLITLFCLFAVFSATVKKCRNNTSCFTKYYLHESDVGIQMRYATYTLLLLIFYLIFKLPYVINDLVTQLSPAENNQKTIVSYNSKISDETDFLQTALVWLMFCFSTVYPVLTVAWFADHRHGLFASLCNRTRLKLLSVRSKTDPQVTDQSSPGANSNCANGQLSSERKWCRGRVQSLSKENSGAEMTSISAEVGFQVPVLYATSDGLHLMETGPKSNHADLITDLRCAEVKDFLRSDGNALSDSDGKRFVPGTTFSRFMETGDGPTCEPRSSSILSKDTVKSSLDSQVELSCNCSGSETSLLRLSGSGRTLLLPKFRTPVELQYGSATSLPQKAAWDTLPDPWCSFVR